MNLLRKNWFLVIISLLAGGLITEIIHLLTGNPTRPWTTNITLLYALIIYGVVVVIVKKTDNKR